jgi:putative ABC transport system ATP-binding protein
MSIVEIKKLNMIFNKGSSKEFQALKEIDFSLKKGEFCILKGVSGSGKSTLLSLIGALLKPTSGEIRVFDKPISKMPDFHTSKFRREYIGFIFQHFNLFNELSVLENVQSALVPTKTPANLMSSRAVEVLKLVKLEHKKDGFTRDLSGGEKQRCAIARALINKPKLILADEPTANLDLENSKNIINILKTLNKSGESIIVATHDEIFEDMVENATIVNISEGRIV